MQSGIRTDNENSCLLFRLMGVLGYSVDEIEIRRLKSRYHDLCSELFLPNQVFRYMNYAGSFGEGLEGNNRIRNQVPTDTDEIMVYKYPEIYDSDIDTCRDCIFSKKDFFNSNSHVHIESDIYPGYVKLFTKNKDMTKKMCIPNTDIPNLTEWDRELIVDLLKIEFNGPAVTRYFYTDSSLPTARHNSPEERVSLLFYNQFPKEADEFLSRERPNEWPSNETIRIIKTKGCFVAPAGHFDSPEKHLQWRISFHGEKDLFSDLNHIQMLCYVILKWVLKTEIIPVAKDALSSYHLKHAVFWSVQLLQCEWTPENLLPCLRMCVNQVKMYVSRRILPHFIIKERNLLNSKLTKEVSDDVVVILEKYNTGISKIFELRMFKTLINQNEFDIEDYINLTNESIILAYFSDVMIIFSKPTYFINIWNRYEKHNAAQSLQNYEQVLSTLCSNKTISFLPIILYVQSILNLLSYALWQEHEQEKDLQQAERYFRMRNPHCFIPHTSTLLRDLMYLYMRKDYQTIHDCFTGSMCFQMEKESSIKESDSLLKQTAAQYTCLLNCLCLNINTNELVTVKKNVKDAFYCSGDFGYNEVKTSCAEIKIVDLMRRTPYDMPLFHHANVFFMSAEKWGVAEVIQLELLSHQTSFSGIILTSYFCCKVLAFLTNYQLGNVEENLKILCDMDSYLHRSFDEWRKHPDCTISFDSAMYEPITISFNIVAYCNRKAKRNQQAMTHILQSIMLFPSKQNSSWGYLKCIIMILRTLF